MFRILDSSEHTDLVVKVNDAEYKVHKLIFCGLSRFFEKACKNFKEAETGVVELKHGDPEMLRHMITWIKTGEYCDDSTCSLTQQATAEKMVEEAAVPATDTEEGWNSIDDDETGIQTSSDEYRGSDTTSAPDMDASGYHGYCQHPITFDIEMFALAGKKFTLHL